MSRRRISLNSTQSSEESSAHSDRPWVYFMVDCFFLITEFFVITFKIKNDEAVLPQRLPPGGIPGPVTSHTPIESLYVHVVNEGGQPRYKFNDVTLGESALSDRLVAAARAKSGETAVKVSYDADVQWKDVMTVFNTCNKARIAQCGLIPLRGDKAGK
jgi:biopolymer transport protein ExbD